MLEDINNFMCEKKEIRDNKRRRRLND